MKNLMWKILSIICWIGILSFSGLAFKLTDNRYILEVLVLIFYAFMFITMWEITKEAFKK